MSARRSCGGTPEHHLLAALTAEPIDRFIGRTAAEMADFDRRDDDRQAGAADLRQGGQAQNLPARERGRQTEAEAAPHLVETVEQQQVQRLPVGALARQAIRLAQRQIQALAIGVGRDGGSADLFATAGAAIESVPERRQRIEQKEQQQQAADYEQRYQDDTDELLDEIGD